MVLGIGVATPPWGWESSTQCCTDPSLGMWFLASMLGESSLLRGSWNPNHFPLGGLCPYGCALLDLSLVRCPSSCLLFGIGSFLSGAVEQRLAYYMRAFIRYFIRWGFFGSLPGPSLDSVFGGITSCGLLHVGGVSPIMISFSSTVLSLGTNG